MNIRIIVAVCLLSLLPVTYTYSQEPASNSVTTGPVRGTLVIVGGGRLSDTIINRFIELAGGPEARIVLVPTAAGAESYADSDGDMLRSRGAKYVTVFHTYNRDSANSVSFTRPLENADGVWFGGGRQWHLVDAYKGTLTETLFRKVLDRGGVIGGTSAGATIQGSFLARGDTRNNQIMMGDHQEGFGYVSNIAIDQHVLARNRQFDMYEIIREKPELLGIGIDENTAAIVRGDTLEVIGASYVLIYDGSFWSREGSEMKKLPEKEFLFYLLKQGDRYDLRKRAVLSQPRRQ